MTIDDVLEELTLHGFEDVDEDQALRVINETLDDVAAREPWPSLLTTAAVTYDSDGRATDWPNDVGTISAVYRLYGRGKTIPYRRTDDRRDLPIDGFGEALFYTIEDNKVRIYGPPSGQVGIDYFRIPEHVEAGTLEPDIWLPARFHRGIIVNGAVYKLYLMEDDVELSREFERLFEKSVENARQALHLQNLEGDYIHVVNPDDWDYD